MNKTMRVVQCWDDGVTADIRVIEILRRHGAKATFNLNAAFHEAQRSREREYQGTTVAKLALGELNDVYQGFTIANHSLTHPSLADLPREAALQDIVDGRKQLQDLFQAPILGFAYPNGSCNPDAMETVREAGHVYARTTKNVDPCFPPEDPMAFHANCHFRNPDFWTKYENAKASGVFYFWGHSYEMVTDAMWAEFEDKVKRISTDPDAQWDVVEALFGDPMAAAQPS